MTFKFTNFAETTLQRKVFDDTTEFVVDVVGAAGTFPAIGVGDVFPAVLQDGKQDPEIVYITATVGEVWTVLRGREETAARAWMPGTLLTHTITAGTLNADQGVDLAISALDARVDSLEVDVASIQANITTTFIEIENNYEALASLTNALDTSFGSFSSSVTTTLLSLSDEDVSLAASITALEAENDSFSASLTTEISTRVTADAALAARSTTLEAQMANTSGSGLSARIGTEETTRATQTSALASRNTTLEAQMTGATSSFINSRIATEETTRASAIGALATRSTVLESSVRGTLPSLLTEDGAYFFNGISGSPTSLTPITANSVFSFTTDNAGLGREGRALEVNGSAGDQFVSQMGVMLLKPGHTYRGSMRMWANGVTTGCEARIYLLALDSAYNYTGGSLGAQSLTIIDNGIHVLSCEGFADPYIALGGVYVRVCAYFIGGPTHGNAYHLLSLSLEDVTDVATTTARIATEETTRATETSALSARVTTIEASGVFDDSALYAALLSEETARISADSAEATLRVTLESKVDTKVRSFYTVAYPTPTAVGDLWFDIGNDNKPYRWSGSTWVPIQDGTIATVAASVVTEASTRATADTALATRATTLEAQVADTAGSGLRSRIATEETTRASADTTEASARTTLESKVDTKTRVFRQTSAPAATAVGDLWFDTDDANKPYAWDGSSWTAVRDTTIATAQSDATAAAGAASTAAGAASAAQTTADGKVKTFLQTSAPTATAVGDIWIDSDDDNKLYRWSGSSWVAVPDARIAANTAAITTESTTRATDVSALASRVTTLEAATGGYDDTAVYAAISSEASARASADSAMASDITTLTSSVGTNASAISSEAATRASADSALSSTVTTLSSTVGGHTSTLLSHALTLTSIDGALLGKSGVLIDLDGYVSGYELLTVGGIGTSYSEFRIKAGKFVVENPATGTDDPMFEIDGSNVARIAGERVVTDSILDAAITNAVSSVVTSNQTISSGATTTTSSVTITTTGKRIELLCCQRYAYHGVDSSSYDMYFTVWRDSTQLFSNVVFNVTANTGYEFMGGIVTLPIYDTPSAGTYTYYIKSKAVSRSHVIGYSSIRAMEIKK